MFGATAMVRSFRIAGAAIALVLGLESLGGAPVAGFAQELVDDSVYETGNGTEITWDDEWVVGSTLTGTDPESPEFGEFEMVALAPEDDADCALFCGVSIVVWSADNVEPADVHDSYVEIKVENGGYDLLLEDTGREVALSLLANGNDEDSDAVLYVAYPGGDDEVFSVTVSGSLGMLAGLTAAADASIEIDGDSLLAVVDLDEVEDVLAESAAGSGDDRDAGTSSEDSYVEDVEAQYEEWSGDFDRFNDIIENEDLSDDAIQDEFFDLLDVFEEAPDVAAGFDAPRDQADLEDAFLAYAGGLADVTEAIDAFFATEEDSPEEDDAWDDFLASLDEVDSLAGDLEDELDAAAS